MEGSVMVSKNPVEGSETYHNYSDSGNEKSYLHTGCTRLVEREILPT